MQRVLVALVCLLILRITGGIVSAYPDYARANFESQFLYGRESYFYNGYHLAFYAHIASGPCSLVFGMVLLSERFRIRFPTWHRILGRVQAVVVLLFVVPGGLWMAWYADGGGVASAGFAILGLATGVAMVRGWSLAVGRQFVEHRRWMWRCYLLLCSAIVLRIVGGLSVVTGQDDEWVYPVAAWACWLLPLAVFEIVNSIRVRTGLSPSAADSERS